MARRKIRIKSKADTPAPHSTTARGPCLAAPRARTSPRVCIPRLMSIAGVGLTTFVAGERPRLILFIHPPNKSFAQPYALDEPRLPSESLTRPRRPLAQGTRRSPRSHTRGRRRSRPRAELHRDVTSRDAPPTRPRHHRRVGPHPASAPSTAAPVVASPVSRRLERTLSRRRRTPRRKR